MATPDTTASIPRGRRVACARCGGDFGCGLSGECWCASVPARLPLPADSSEDCLCPSCLRKAAEAVIREQQEDHR